MLKIKFLENLAKLDQFLQRILHLSCNIFHQFCFLFVCTELFTQFPILQSVDQATNICQCWVTIDDKMFKVCELRDC